MTDYSRMSYEQLRRIANNDAVADRMSEEEYEALSVQMWRKFSVEQGLREHHDSLACAPGMQTLRTIWNRLTSHPAAAPPTLPPSENSVASPRQLKGAFRSGD
jgi:hypothetical protein